MNSIKMNENFENKRFRKIKEICFELADTRQLIKDYKYRHIATVIQDRQCII